MQGLIRFVLSSPSQGPSRMVEASQNYFEEYSNLPSLSYNGPCLLIVFEQCRQETLQGRDCWAGRSTLFAQRRSRQQVLRRYLFWLFEGEHRYMQKEHWHPIFALKMNRPRKHVNRYYSNLCCRRAIADITV